jgi:hypothetical protein
VTKNKQNKHHNTICVGYRYTQRNTNKVNKTWASLQTTGGKDEPTSVTHDIVKYQFYSLWFDPTGLEFTALESITITITPPIRFRSQSTETGNIRYTRHKTKNKQNKHHNTICVGYRYTQRNTNKVNKTWHRYDLEV